MFWHYAFLFRTEESDCHCLLHQSRARRCREGANALVLTKLHQRFYSSSIGIRDSLVL
jgi:hypothetical protein